MFEQAIASLKNHTNVYDVASNQTAAKLASLFIEPTVRVRTNETWYTTWRESAKDDAKFAYVFNDGPISVDSIEVSTEGAPYSFDLWTRKITPILHYQHTGGKTIIPLTLQANQTVVIGFRRTASYGSAAPALHATSLPSIVLGYRYSNDSSSVELHIGSGVFDRPLTLSSGEDYTSVACISVSPSFQLSNWTLIAEHWDAPSNISDAPTVASKYNTTHSLAALVSWIEIHELANSSGLGHYFTNFEWTPSKGSADGAYIVFPKIAHALRLFINGKQVPPLDYNDPRADIGPYLNKGQNQVLAVVPTTMWNYLRSIFDSIIMSGLPPLITVASSDPIPGQVDNGLIGTVKIMPYAIVTVGEASR